MITFKLKKYNNNLYKFFMFGIKKFRSCKKFRKSNFVIY